MKAIKWFWDKGEISRGYNASFLTLILKVKDPTGLGEFWPISLIRGYYKIIAKVLACRLERVLGNVVGEVQNAFIKERYILNVVMLANEVVDYLKKKREILMWNCGFREGVR